MRGSGQFLRKFRSPWQPSICLRCGISPHSSYEQFVREFSTPLENHNKNWNWVPPRNVNESELELENQKKLEIIEGYDSYLLSHPFPSSLPSELSCLTSIRQYFTPEEVASVMQTMKGIDVKIVQINGKLQGITHFIIGSGESTRHLQNMADVLVRSVRDRKLMKAPSFKFGAEGSASSRKLFLLSLIDFYLFLDWMVVDMWNVVAHLMMPSMSLTYASLLPLSLSSSPPPPPSPPCFCFLSSLETRQRYNLEAHWSSPTRPYAVYKKGSNEKKSNENYHNSLDELCNQYPPPQDEDDEGEDHTGEGDQEDGFQQNNDGKGIRLNKVHTSGFIFSKPPKEFLNRGNN